ADISNYYPLLEVKEENTFVNLSEDIYTSIKNLNSYHYTNSNTCELQFNDQVYEQESIIINSDEYLINAIDDSDKHLMDNVDVNQDLILFQNWKNENFKLFVEIGREDGIKNGIKAGTLEGRLLGCEKGYELLSEIGFYDGVAEILIKQLTSLRELISTFPIENQQNVEFLDLLSKVRSKYKVCTSLLGVTNSQKFKKTTESAPLV
ncbi:9538_t:CDS:2, partial [Racocetra fulgida]